MNFSLPTPIYRTYVLWSLFLSGYASLALIFAMRLVAKSRPVKAEVCVGIAVFPDYSLTFDDGNDLVTLWTRDGGKRLKRIIANVRERGILTPRYAVS